MSEMAELKCNFYLEHDALILAKFCVRALLERNV
jgi:hypothetical protein